MTNTLEDPVADNHSLWDRKKCGNISSFLRTQYLPEWEEGTGTQCVDGRYCRTVGKGGTIFSEVIVEGFGIE